jgi:hypothetical protein
MLRVVVAAQKVAPMKAMRRVAIERMREMATFDARRVRFVKSSPFGDSIEIEARTFEVDAIPLAV